MAQVQGCLGQYAVCAIRASRLNDVCCPEEGDMNAVAQRCVVSFTASPEREEGTEYVCTDGCGEVCWTIKDCDKEKRMNLDLEMCIRDLELIELLSTAQICVDAEGNCIGVERQGTDVPCPNGAGIELWAKVGYETGACPPDPAAAMTIPKWWRMTYPRAFMWMGDTTMENDVYRINLTGYSDPNPCWQDGAFNDYPAPKGMGPNALESIVLDAAGPPDTQCGYIAVPPQGVTEPAPVP